MLPLQVLNGLFPLILLRVGDLGKPGLLVCEDWLFPAHFPHRLSVTWPKPCVCVFEQVLFSLRILNPTFLIHPPYYYPKLNSASCFRIGSYLKTR